MLIKGLFTENQLGLLEEALNIGAGNAVTALSQILQCDADMSFPVLKGILASRAAEIYQSTGIDIIGVEMNIVGELQGALLVVIPENDEHKLTNLIRQAKEEQRGEGIADSSIITETSNIMAGAFLTSIHDFCGLNVFHTVPVAEKRGASYLSGMLGKYADDPNGAVLVITNEFTVNKSNIKAFLLVILSQASTSKLIEAIERIRVV
jgi:chemotaxis protein CheC